MASYIFEMEPPTFCHDCPMFDDGRDYCHIDAALGTGKLRNTYVNSDGSPYVVRDDSGHPIFEGVPDWCPLVPIDSDKGKLMWGELWIKNVNSQPTKDEPIHTLKVDLYQSEIDKLGILASRNMLSTAQMVAKLIEEASDV